MVVVGYLVFFRLSRFKREAGLKNQEKAGLLRLGVDHRGEVMRGFGSGDGGGLKDGWMWERDHDIS
jgi:hypothetical protein